MALHKSAFLLCFLCFHLAISQDGWFGPNKEFKCHCEPGCNADGTCLSSGKCARGWFGLKCQHQDLTVLDNTILSPNDSALTDRDDTTCLNKVVQSITVTFNRTYVFTWLRLTVKDPALLPGFTVQFSKTTSTSSKLECLNQKYFLVDTDTLDIQCDLTEAIQTVIITGTGQTALCSLYINGGRNVALKQKTWQTSNYSEGSTTYDASRAVDGNTNSDLYSGSCTHTNLLNPMWNVTFPLSEITRYVLYNRNNNQDRLAGFNLVGENSGSQKFSYNDTPPTVLSVYIVVDAAKNNLNQVKIRTTQIVTLCETEIYGECPASTYTNSNLQCTNCPATCQNSCHVDSGSCNTCVGFSNPPSCTVVCAAGRFGINCTQTCPINCFNKLCDPMSGVCLMCIAGYYGNSCDKACNETTYGQNCYQTCSTNCTDKKCDPVYGKCLQCYTGFTGDFCNQYCKETTYGQNCLLHCSTTCTDQKCDPINGKCNLCIPGYKGNYCNQTCSTGQFGINCSETCTNCFGKACDLVSGVCSMCVPGFYGDYCDKVCNETTYGQNCSQTCSLNCTNRKCDPVDGKCFQCYPGFTGDFCSQICQETIFGQNCTKTCSTNCTDQKCHPVNGKCNLCVPGYIGDFCNQTCAKDKWGPDCQFNCRNNCFNLSCDRQNGKCEDGCDGFMDPPDCTVECGTGKWGHNCFNECDSRCKHKSCDRVTGLCDYVCDSLTNLSCPADCPSGYHGSNCTLQCSATCKDQLCNRLGYCITCLPGHTGLYCENGLASETECSGLTFSSGVGVGVAVGAVVIILVDVVVVIVCRTRITTFRNRSNTDSQTSTQQRTYDSLKQMNEYSHSYETSNSTFEVKDKSNKKRDIDLHDKKTEPYENTSNTVYETVG